MNQQIPQKQKDELRAILVREVERILEETHYFTARANGRITISIRQHGTVFDGAFYSQGDKHA